MQTPLSALLTSGCEQLGLALTETQTQHLLAYIEALEKWNKTYNLTAVRDSETMLKRHVLDALSVVKLVRQQQPATLADIGTGAGIPGVILAIMLPELQVFLVESIGKKCRFLRHVINVLAIKSRVHVVQQRVEDWQPQATLGTSMSVVICRAFTSLNNFTTITRHLGDENTVWLAMKSAYTAEEERNLTADFILEDNMTLNVPFESAGRRLLVLRRA